RGAPRARGAGGAQRVQRAPGGGRPARTDGPHAVRDALRLPSEPTASEHRPPHPRKATPQQASGPMSGTSAEAGNRTSEPAVSEHRRPAPPSKATPRLDGGPRSGASMVASE